MHSLFKAYENTPIKNPTETLKNRFFQREQKVPPSLTLPPMVRRGPPW
jgi:hypothetical protein